MNTALDDVQGSVENGTDSTTDGTRDQVVCHLALLGTSLGQHLSDLEDAAKVTGVPKNMSPHGTLQTLIHGQDTLVLDSLDNAVNHAIVLASGCLVLETDLDELERNNDEGLGGTSGGTSQNRQGLVHLVHAEHLAVSLAPFIVGGELGSTLGGFHEDGG